MTVTVVLIITLQAVLLASCADVKHKNDDRIVFPGPVKEVTQNRYGGVEDEVPDQCKDKKYCTVRPPDYPQEKFNNLIKYKIPLDQPVLSGFDDRQGDPDEVDNCETQVEFEPLYKVRAQGNSAWRTVVQAPEKNFVQLVRLETCKETEAPCFTVFPKMPTYKTFCKQKFTTWHFVVESENPDGVNKTEKIPVDLPTCCSCHYKPV